MKGRICKNLASIIILLLIGNSLFSATYSTKTTADGAWTNSGNWDGTYPGCCTLTGPSSGHTYNIYGKISVGSSSTTQDLSIDKGFLIVQDTLIIYGDLIVGNNGSLLINDGAVLIVYGDVYVDNQVDISANSYFIVMGDFTKTGSADQGSFQSNDEPANVYIMGTITVPSQGNPPVYWATTGTNDVLNCDLTTEHETSQCNYGTLPDMEDSPISEIVTSNCVPVPVIYSIGANTPVVEGNTINGWSSAGGPYPATVADYTWTGPLSYVSSSSSSGSFSRSSATTAMSGYYVLTVTNDRGCKIYDSVHVGVVTACCNGANWFSFDNNTGSWTDASNWGTSSGYTAPPDYSNVASGTACINGYITLGTDVSPLSLNISNGNLKVCDTLVIWGDLTGSSHSINVTSTGVLIVMGNVSVTNGSITNAGRIVVAGDAASTSYGVTNTNDIYVFGTNTSAISNPGNESDLQADDETLYTFYSGISCGTGLTGGIIASDQTLCSGDDVDSFTSSSGAGPGTGFTYKWYQSVNSSNPSTGTWNEITGETGETYDHGILSQTTYFYRKATKGVGCSANSNVITVSVNTLPAVSITSVSSDLCTKDSRTLTATPSGGTFSVLATSTASGTISGSDVLMADSTGQIDIEYTYTDINGCINTDTQSITIILTPETGPQYRKPNQ